MRTSWIIWGTLILAGAVALAVVVRTRWLESNTLKKCVLISLALHAVLAVVCGLMGGLAPASWGRAENGRMTMMVVLAEEPAEDRQLADAAPRLREAGETPDDAAETPIPSDASTAPDATPPLVDLAAVSPGAQPESAAAPGPESLAAVPSALPGSAARATDSGSEDVPTDLVPLLEPPPNEPQPAEQPPAPPAPDDSSRGVAKTEKHERATPAGAEKATPMGAAAAPVAAAAVPAMPEAYADRVGSRRAAAAAARGGSQETERAVQAALAWLAAAQSGDGRWNAARHGGGVERSVQGHHRQGAGAKSDHGVTGLALLAMLGAGNTHREGVCADHVDRGIRFLVDRQRSDGSLAGDAEFFAALYCHGMAAIALAECCAMTGDPALRPPLERAVRHTLSMQSPATGGWRYAAGDRGDTSQLGWQVMVLSSARNAGIGGLERAESGARAFLQSVSSGRAGGLASYRAGERTSVAMTAEALVCRLFLGLSPDHPCVGEAVEMIGNSLPDAAHPNAYTWYYATLASFHVGGPQWDRWNGQLQRALLPLQRRDGSDLDGSWDPDPVWGGHGGRVYSTALAAMTLEVYYRHLPMHRRAPAVTASR